MKKLITATKNGTKVYGKLFGLYELCIDTSGPYVPGWIPDCEYFYFDAMETVDGEILAVDVQFEGDGTPMYVAFKPEEDFRFMENKGQIATVEYGWNERKRGRHSKSNNKKRYAKKLFEANLPF